MLKRKGNTMTIKSNAPVTELVAFILNRQEARGHDSETAHIYSVGYLASMLEKACNLSPKVRKDVQSHLDFIKGAK
jgi:hypothetical protein